MVSSTFSSSTPGVVVSIVGFAIPKRGSSAMRCAQLWQSIWPWWPVVLGSVVQMLGFKKLVTCVQNSCAEVEMWKIYICKDEGLIPKLSLVIMLIMLSLCVFMVPRQGTQNARMRLGSAGCRLPSMDWNDSGYACYRSRLVVKKESWVLPQVFPDRIC